MDDQTIQFLEFQEWIKPIKKCIEKGMRNTIKHFQNQELSTEDDLTTSLTESGRMRELQDKVPWLLIESLWDLIDLILMVYIGNIDQNQQYQYGCIVVHIDE